MIMSAAEIQRQELSRAAMKALCEKHPDLTFQQVVKVMQEATWSFDGNKATCAMRLPAGDPEDIEVNIVSTDD
jgi:hypothetical protein